MHPSRFLHLSADQLSLRATAVVDNLEAQPNPRLKALAGHVAASRDAFVETQQRLRTAVTAHRNSRAVREDHQDSLLQMARALVRDVAESHPGTTMHADLVLDAPLLDFEEGVRVFLRQLVNTPGVSSDAPLLARLDLWLPARAAELAAHHALDAASSAHLHADTALRARMRAAAYVVRDELLDGDAIQAVFASPAIDNA
jgi:hypothetical protein